MTNKAYSLWRLNGCQQGFRFLASFGFGGQESASKPQQTIYKHVTTHLRKTLRTTIILLLILVSSLSYGQGNGLYKFLSENGKYGFMDKNGKIKVEFGGIFPMARLPYPISGGIINVRFSPLLIRAMASSQPLMTLPCPSGKLNGLSRS